MYSIFKIIYLAFAFWELAEGYILNSAWLFIHGALTIIYYLMVLQKRYVIYYSIPTYLEMAYYCTAYMAWPLILYGAYHSQYEYAFIMTVHNIIQHMKLSATTGEWIQKHL